MKAMNIANKLVSTARVSIFLAIIALPLNAQAEYYLVYGSPAVACDSCQTSRVYYRHPCKVHKVHRVKPCKKRYYHVSCHRRSHYTMSVYYPVPVYTPPCGCSRPSCGSCGCCNGFLRPTYYWAPAPARVYYQYPDDRLVGNRYEERYYDDYNPSLDTGTADNDIE